VGLFAGIGGFERGLAQVGIEPVALYDIDPAARQVLKHRFGVRVGRDVRDLRTLPRADVLAAGFPCQDLSQAGRTNGIRGSQSRLVDEVFRLVREAAAPPRWIVLENVPFMLRIGRGAAMRYLMERFAEAGYKWAFRTVDARAFGLPQRRRRVLIIAAKEGDPTSALLSADAPRVFDERSDDAAATGFYWTEGNGGVGWAWNSVPPLKGGSGCGIPSPPAVWLREGAGLSIVTPGIASAERLQGFPAGWTKSAAGAERREGARWRLIGNAVCVRTAKWLGAQLTRSANAAIRGGEKEADPALSWPAAGHVAGRTLVAVDISDHPSSRSMPSIRDFMGDDYRPLSSRAAAGFLFRMERNSLSRPAAFEEALRAHIAATSEA
jgi:DNA (cytosine-5)-methyltransferase 1